MAGARVDIQVEIVQINQTIQMIHSSSPHPSKGRGCKQGLDSLDEDKGKGHRKGCDSLYSSDESHFQPLVSRQTYRGLLQKRSARQHKSATGSHDDDNAYLFGLEGPPRDATHDAHEPTARMMRDQCTTDEMMVHKALMQNASEASGSTSLSHNAKTHSVWVQPRRFRRIGGQYHAMSSPAAAEVVSAVGGSGGLHAPRASSGVVEATVMHLAGAASGSDDNDFMAPQALHQAISTVGLSRPVSQTCSCNSVMVIHMDLKEVYI